VGCGVGGVCVWVKTLRTISHVRGARCEKEHVQRDVVVVLDFALVCWCEASLRLANDPSKS
jgi:hypothetical protein